MSTTSTKGAPREVLRLAWPIAISMMSFTVKGFVDTLMVGHLGTNSLAAVGIASVAIWMALTFPWGILRGQRPLISQYLGAGNPKLAFSFGVHAFYLALICGLLLLIFANQITNAFQAYASSTELNKESVIIALQYFKTRVQWLLPTLLTFAIAEYLRSIGDTKTPMLIDLFVHPMNIFFNWVLIFGHLGIEPLGAEGAALGTGIADLFALILIIALSKSKHSKNIELFRPNIKKLLEVMKVGFTGAIQYSVEALSFVTITWFIGKTGTAGIAVHQVGIQLVHISMLGGASIADGGSVLIGKYVGEKNYSAVKNTLRSILKLITPYMLFIGACFVIFRYPLANLFIHESDTEEYLKNMQLASGVLIAAAIWQCGDIFQIAFRFALRAAGDHIWVMWAGILCTWLLAVPVVWLVVFVFQGDVADIWMAWNLEIAVGSLFFIQRWRSQKWIKKRLVKEDTSVK